MTLILEAFAQAQGINQENPGLLVLDKAGWHITDKLEIPPGLFLEFLPAYSPELQTAERLWPLLDESIMNKVFDSYEELKQAIYYRAAE
ncbi:MAG: transposase [Trichodesmium sp. MAG_R04]|nr:transposase [Trichodesmium sp. MAG_R04]